MHGEVKYKTDFQHFDYVNPDAPKGGTLKMAADGTYDSFNPYILKGQAAEAMGLAFETLMTSSDDEAFSQYGLIAKYIYMPEDRDWVAYTLRKDARWHDGEPITVEDVIWSFNTLKEQGHPQYRFYYKNVKSARQIGPRTVRFEFSEGLNRELPLILGQLPVLPKHYWTAEGRTFGKSTLEPPLGSGPYKVTDYEPGRYVVFERVEDYWGRDLAVNRGRWNYDKIRYDYFRDPTVIRSAIKAGNVDFRLENTAKAWATAYDVPAVRQGRLKKVKLENSRPTGMQAFVMNTRRAPFDQPKVREAMSYAFDFGWTNKNLFFGQYIRTESYFSNSELASDGLPTGREKEILEQFRGQVPPEVFTQEYDPPETDGNGYPRDNLKKALGLLREAGFEVRDMKLIDPRTGRPVTFEILLNSQAFERVVLPYVANLNRLGIEVDVSLVDSVQYQNRLDSYDFDMTVGGWPQSLSPGNEQRSFWGSAAAERPGTRNWAGIQDPVIDKLIDMVIAAPSREELVARTRALDRVLLWHHYVVPNWHMGAWPLVYWDKFRRPETTAPYALNLLDAWWIAPEKEQQIARAQAEANGDAAQDTGRSGVWLTALGVLVLAGLALLFFRRGFHRKASQQGTE
ncbi:ABC transporter substrate-binding protein [Rhodovibrio salinarum]|uniref:ABC transporter substrate-binding protein n=2 Tax=Rhodovibrio salinarum TaxID=1087 RepID=A0A934QG90_9PROT|nr:ABC transporter substrate-binding protein [Rhodovibrio salinarum]